MKLLASLKTIFEPPDYKFLFLDDIFIGLDTSNRIPLLNILQNEFDEYLKVNHDKIGEKNWHE